MTGATLGRIVIYRNRAGIDMPAIVTGLDDTGAPFLHCFPPPGQAADGLHSQWGAPFEDVTIVYEQEDGHKPGCWRWPERTN